MKSFISRNIRYFIIVLTLFLGSFSLVLFTSQYWLPRMLPSALKIMGIEVQSINRTNGGRIIIGELSYSSETIILNLKKIVLPNLHQYLFTRLIGNKWDVSSLVEVEIANLRIKQNALSKQDSKEVSPVFPADMIRSLHDYYLNFSWLVPPVSIEISNISSDKFEIQLYDFEIKDKNFNTILKSTYLPKPVALHATIDTEAHWMLQTTIDNIDLSLDINMEQTPDGYLFSGEIHRAGEVVELSLELKFGEFLPKIFRVRSTGFTLDNSLLSLCSDWSGGSIELQFVQIDWDSGIYTANFQSGSNFPTVGGLTTPLDASVEIEGNLTAMTIRSLDLNSSSVKASLNGPIILDFEDGIKVFSPIKGPELTVSIDLSQQSLIDAEGQLSGRILIPYNESLETPILHLEVSGNALAYAGQRIQSVQAIGFLKDTTIILESVIIKPDLENNSEIVVDGQIDLSTQVLKLDYDIRLTSEYIHAFLEKPVVSDRLQIKGSAEGPWLSPIFNFEVIEAKLNIPELNTISLQGMGSIENFETFKWNGFAESEGSYINAELTFQISAEATHLELVNLTLSDPQLPELVLREPVSIDFNLGADNVFDCLSISAFELSDVEKKISGIYSPETGFSLEVNNFSCAWLNRWLRNPLLLCELKSLHANITALDPFPKGNLEVNLQELDIRNLLSNQNLPIVNSIQLQASINSEYLEIPSLRIFLNQSELEGHMTLPTICIADWLSSDSRETKKLLKKLQGKLILQNWKMEDWIEQMPPGLFRRSGSLTGSLEINENFDFSGLLKFQNFALRPTEHLFSIDQISGTLVLIENRFEIQSASALIGDSNVVAAGWADLRNIENILWDVQITGENIPMLRTTDMILRSNVNLEAQHLEQTDQPLVQGRLDLRDSTLLVEFDPLASNTESGPGLRPPFFSIEHELIKDWLLDITIFGETFMRVSSPYLKTQLSADFHLGGSFREPELVGRIQTNDGKLFFPSLKMLIDKGEAFIEPSQLDTVQLDFTGTAQSASHIITMEVSNTLDEPYIQFRSTPELPNTSIVRLLTMGTTSVSSTAAAGLYLGKGLLGPGGMDETIMDRLTIDFGEKRSRSGRQMLSADLYLDENWSLNGGYDQYDAYNMNLIWNLFRR